MPKKTFFRLPEAKQQRLMTAARIEFSRARFEDASISNIIKLASIPRGSFYQYFEDKADIFDYYVQQIFANMDAEWKACLEDKHHGDLFAAFRDFFAQKIVTVLSGPNAAFFERQFTHVDRLNASNKEDHQQRAHKHPHHKSIERMISNVTIDYSKLKIDTPEDAANLFSLLMLIVIQSLGSYFRQKAAGVVVPTAEIVHMFNHELDWLEFGVSKPQL
ncbi:transcriptional regulator [Lactobacillus selangorensis]|uniref:Transcriptional regulator n=1 Tax=Lactobacillus selangorensis TaxID=81857 RepID=A0A0R2FM64_9LACO|nr:TetR family transcriptional regulator [Lactobacillus selangorensis]KRN29294.1 transcriptional regulator [Lactobacillus selangorensis]KRN34177.1 transcriptional regulator [Lactobacillus selangorensis]